MDKNHFFGISLAITLTSGLLISSEPASATKASTPKANARDLAEISIKNLEVDEGTKQLLLRNMEANGKQFFSTAHAGSKIYSIASICLAPVVDTSIRDQTVHQMAVSRLLKKALYSSDEFNEKISSFFFHEIFRKYATSGMNVDISYKIQTTKLINLTSRSGNCSACIAIMPTSELEDFVDAAISRIDFNSEYSKCMLKNAQFSYHNRDFNACSKFLDEALKYHANKFPALLLKYKCSLQIGRKDEAPLERMALVERFGMLLDSEHLENIISLTVEKGLEDETNAWNEFICSQVQKTISLEDFGVSNQ
jgi:hypothetical protein